MSDTWRYTLSPSETMVLAEVESELEFHRFKTKALSQERRAIYLRAKKRLAREQKSVDTDMQEG